MKKNILFFCVMLLSVLSLSSCSKDDDNDNSSATIQVNDELWKMTPYIAPMFGYVGDDNMSGSHRFNYDFIFRGYVGDYDDGGSGDDYYIDFMFYSQDKVKKGDDVAKKQLIASRYRSVTYVYKSGSAIITDYNSENVTIKFDKLTLKAEDEVPYYASDILVVDGTLKFDVD